MAKRPARHPLGPREKRRGLLLFAAVFLLCGLLPSTAEEPARAPMVAEALPRAPIIAVQLAKLSSAEGLALEAQPLWINEGGERRFLGPSSHEIRWGEGGATIDGLPLAEGALLETEAGRDLLFLGHEYPGRFTLRTRGKEQAFVALVPIEDYLEGVIAAEMGASQGLAALEAQAICARSFALRRILRNPEAPWHLDVTQMTQVWRGWPKRRDRTRRAIEATAGIVLVHEGEILEAVYSSTCGGTTRAAGEAFGGKTIPPLAGVTCEHCRAAPLYRWTARVPLAVLCQAASVATDLKGPPTIERSSSKRMIALHFVDREGRTGRLEARRVRQLVGDRLRSRWVEDLRIQGRDLVLNGRGFGHGVGLCQYGARSLARTGAGVQEILALYYPGAALARAWQPEGPSHE